MIRITVIVMALALLSGPAFAQYDAGPKPFPTRDFGIGLAQFAAAEGSGTGCLGVAYLGVVVAIISFLPEGQPSPRMAATGIVIALASAALSPLADAGAAYVVGNQFYAPEEQGLFGLTTAGAYLGLLTAIGIGALGTTATDQSDNLTWYLPALVLPEAGAVVGYQLSRPNRVSGIGYRGPGHERRTTNAERRFCPSRFDLPSVGLRFNGKRRAQPSTALDLRLLSVRF